MNPYSRLVLADRPSAYFPADDVPIGSAASVTSIREVVTNAWWGLNFTRSSGNGTSSRRMPPATQSCPFAVSPGAYCTAGTGAQFTGTQLTVEAWCYPYDTNQRQLFGKNPDTGYSQDWYIGQNSGGGFTFVRGGGNNPNYGGTSSDALPANAIYHVVGRDDGRHRSIWVNGRKHSQIARDPWPYGNQGHTCTLMRYIPNNTFSWNGEAAHFAIYQHALSDRAIREHYLVGLGKLAPRMARAMPSRLRAAA